MEAWRGNYPEKMLAVSQAGRQSSRDKDVERDYEGRCKG
jgi:hypothetical protein